MLNTNNYEFNSIRHLATLACVNYAWPTFPAYVDGRKREHSFFCMNTLLCHPRVYVGTVWLLCNLSLDGKSVSPLWQKYCIGISSSSLAG